MPTSIRQWLRRQRSKFAASNRDLDVSGVAKTPLPSLPFLLDTQQLDSLPASTPESGNNVLRVRGFFHQLPPELRRMILIEAFGRLTLHIHLGLNHPYLPATAILLYGSKLCHTQHGGASVPLQESADKPRKENRDTSKPMAWQWWSCVCHRGDPGGQWFIQPHWDRCLNGRADCWLWPGELPAKCQIGAIGWLRTCWQA